MAEIAIAAAVAAAVSAAAYTVQYALTPKAKPINKGRLSGDIQIQDSRYGGMIPILLGGPPVEEPANDRTLWLKADDADFSALDDDDPITGWTNRAPATLGLDFDVLSGTPLYHSAGGANDQAYVSFESEDAIQGHGAHAYLSVGAYTLFLVMRPRGAGDAVPDVDLGKRFVADGGNYWSIRANDEKFAEVRDVRTGGPTVYGTDYVQNDWYLVEVSFDGSRVSLWVNGGTPSTAEATNILTFANNLIFGAGFASPGVRAAIPYDLAEAIGYQANVSPFTRNAERDYLATKYDLPVTTSPVVLPPTSGGGMRVAGNVVFMSAVRKVETVTPAEGGKFGNKNPDTVTTSYFCDLGIMFSEGEMDLVQFYAGTDLLLDRSATSSTGARDAAVDPDDDADNINLPDPTDSTIALRPAQRFGGIPAEDGDGTVTGTLAGGADFRFYSGSETQLPDPLAEAHWGVGNAPAYLGRCVMWLENFEVGKYGAIPNFTAILANKNLKTAAECIDHLCQRVGLEPSDYDVSNVAQFKVRGIPIVDREGPRNTIELIGQLFGFDVVETNGELVCVMRGGAPSFAVDDDDLGTVEVEGIEDPQAADIPELVQNELQLDQTQLPRRLDLTFFDPARNGERNTQGASRIEALANGFITDEVNAVLTVTEGRQLAQRLIDTAWIESAGAIRFKVPHTFAEDITAAAVGTVTRNGITHTVRVREVNGFVPGVLEVVGIVTRAASYTQSEIAPGGEAGAPVTTPSTPSIPATTVATFIDRILRDRELQDGRPGFYVAACSFGNGSWGSANVFVDRGSGYVHLVNLPEQATMGIVDATPSTIAGGSTVDVVLYADQELPAGPAFVMQGELIYQYGSAVQLSTSPNLWRLSTLTNIGARCTTAEQGSHAAGERLVLLNQALRFVAVESDEIGVARDYKVPTAGADLNDTGVINFTVSAPNIAVVTPVDWAMTAGNGQITHTWTPFADECVMTGAIVYEIYDDASGSPGSLLYSGASMPFTERDLAAATYTRHFRARSAYADGAYLMDSVIVTVTATPTSSLSGRWEPLSNGLPFGPLNPSIVFAANGDVIMILK